MKSSLRKKLLINTHTSGPTTLHITQNFTDSSSERTTKSIIPAI
ncbi:unnamed protein product [Chondrus crispus]|uniref:Uncharacterized protein n=1 Tax=Chondrus crispus TaxID=2769 RepID=R7QFP8_CHOCR|nr:unnamed protein product [Chondrus crispus]CDF37352.1 unnamed protein product [Chondrus crispus]|eukprot:XP_005717171.1 unnamed protein product [Chondrus crispus]